MNEEAILRYITDTFDGIETVSANGDTFIFYGSEHKFPFATIVTSNFNDAYSDLDRPGVFRLNIGVGKETFRDLFGELPTSTGADAFTPIGDDDYAALDRLLPHPVYGRMLWVCVLNPSATTFEEQVRPLLTEAYERASDKEARRAARA